MAFGFTTTLDGYVQGNLYFGGLIFLGGTGPITDAMINPGAAIQATKMQQQRVETIAISNYGSAPAAFRKTIRVVNGTAGTLGKFFVSLRQALASGTFTVDLYKNGSSILSSALTMNSSSGTGGVAGDIVNATFSSAALVAGDVLEIVITVSTPSGGGGAFCQLVYAENPS